MKTVLYECKDGCKQQKFYSDPDKGAVVRACERCAIPLHRKRPARAPRPVVVTLSIVDDATAERPASIVAHAEVASDATGSP